MLQLAFKYYGADWLAMVTSFLFIYLIGHKKKEGFIFGIIANLSWMAFGVMTESIANLITNSVLIVLNIRGYLKWTNFPEMPPKE